MRKSTISLVAVLMCAWVSSFGQDNGLPQWKVVKEFHLTGQTAAVPPTTIFTPVVDGLYRVSFYLSTFTQIPQQNSWSISVRWTDQTGFFGVIGGPLDLSAGGEWNQFSSIFRPRVGTAVTYQVSLSDPPPHDATYDVAVVIEKLTH